MTGDKRAIPISGVSLAISPYRINTSSPTVGIKTLNYLDYVLAWEEAHSRDFDEALLLNERGEIVSATKANIFWVRNGTIHTPALATGALAGITRQTVIEMANQKYIPVVEGSYEISDLVDAEEIFITSSSVGIAQVTTFDFRRYSLDPGNVSGIIKQSFDKRISEI
jgi:branched-subunit amino acid aminotransferase/4-amino-4-deoxychorismate lyase